MTAAAPQSPRHDRPKGASASAIKSGSTPYAPMPMRPWRGVAQAFTLIEVMVVVLIIGLLYGMAVLAIGNPRADALEDSARRLRASIALARDEAVIRGVPLGLRVTEDSYAFLQQTPANGWQELTNDRALGPHKLPVFIRARISVANTPEAAAREAKDDDDDSAVTPQALLMPMVGLTPFTLTLEAEGLERPWRLTGHTDGQLTLEH